MQEWIQIDCLIYHKQKFKINVEQSFIYVLACEIELNSWFISLCGNKSRFVSINVIDDGLQTKLFWRELGVKRQKNLTSNKKWNRWISGIKLGSSIFINKLLKLS